MRGYHINTNTGRPQRDEPGSKYLVWSTLSRKIHRNSVKGLGYLHLCRILSDYEYLLLMSKHNIHNRLRIYEHDRNSDDWSSRTSLPLKEFLKRAHEIEFVMRIKDIAMGLQIAVSTNEMYSIVISTSSVERNTYVQTIK